MQRRPDMAMGQGTNTLSINGGYLFVDAGGDGLDINGPITMTGGPSSSVVRQTMVTVPSTTRGASRSRAGHSSRQAARVW